ncbi:MAG: hypothetical protein QOC98_3254, partial [Frankiaceae bacterium]|nr:hypothetical protein [Frankiaceae bacterium]
SRATTAGCLARVKRERCSRAFRRPRVVPSATPSSRLWLLSRKLAPGCSCRRIVCRNPIQGNPEATVSSSFGRSPPPGYEGDAELVKAGKAREMLSPFVLSSSDLREATQRTLHARGYPAIRVGPLNGRALVVEHPSEEGARLDLLIRSLDPSAHRLQPRAPDLPKAAPPAPRAAEAARWRSVWW